MEFWLFELPVGVLLWASVLWLCRLMADTPYSCSADYDYSDSDEDEFEEGYNEGYNEGWEEGYDAGYDDHEAGLERDHESPLR